MINFVVIDLGSNSVRMKVTRIGSHQELDVIYYQKEFVRLSENMGPEKTLKSAPINRTIKALKKFKEYYTKLDHLKLYAVATAAVRQATNQKKFLNLIKQSVGLKLNVITGSQEAYLDYLGVVNTLPVKDALIIDTGGASTELILVKNNCMIQKTSLPFGSVLLSQDFNLQDKVSAANLFAAENYIAKQLSILVWLNKLQQIPVIALGGSNRTIAKIHRRILTDNKDDLSDIHGMHLPTKRIYALVKRLLTLNQVDRSNIPGLAKVRSDVIIGGLLPISLILRKLQTREVIFSNHGLRDGIVYKYIEKKRK